MTAIASRSETKAQKWAQELGIPRFYGSYDELLENGRIEAVFIGLPNSLHRDWVVKSLRAGKHVLCDKPLGVKAAEAREMAATAEKEQRLLMEGFMYQYHEQYAQMRRWIDEGRIGDVRALRVGFSFYYDQPGNFRYDPELGGGALLDLGCYCVHIGRLLTRAEVRRVQAFSIMGDSGVDWTTTALLQFEGPVTAVLDCSFGYQGERFLHVAGTKGMIRSSRPITPVEDVELTLTSNEETIRKTITTTNLYAKCVDDFQRLVGEGRFKPSPARDSIANLRVLDAIAESAAQGRAVDL